MLQKRAFTLAEVLITLGIIGVVAALTIPTLINSYKDKQFKVAYKKAYSDIQNAFMDAIFEGSLSRDNQFHQGYTTQEFGVMKEKFKVVTDCGNQISNCWAEDGEHVAYASPDVGYPKSAESSCFVDISGRSWCTYFDWENIFMVDTNGFKLPNKIGKDRWLFTLANQDGERTSSAVDYKKVIPFYTRDIKTLSGWCHYPPCNFKSWLYE